MAKSHKLTDVEFAQMLSDNLAMVDADLVDSVVSYRINRLYTSINHLIGSIIELTIANAKKRKVNELKSVLQTYFQELAFYLAYQDCEGVY